MCVCKYEGIVKMCVPVRAYLYRTCATCDVLLRVFRRTVHGTCKVPLSFFKSVRDVCQQ
jgi:hypothetical protein